MGFFVTEKRVGGRGTKAKEKKKVTVGPSTSEGRHCEKRKRVQDKEGAHSTGRNAGRTPNGMAPEVRNPEQKTARETR